MRNIPETLFWTAVASIWLNRYWPWDWKGKRKAIKLQKRKDDWE